MKLIEKYMNILEDSIDEYGKKTVLLMQVGAFYEIYAYNDKQYASYTIIHEIANITGLLVVQKSICVGETSILAAGFRDYSLDKWVNKMQHHGYTCVVYDQDENTKNTSRSLSGIYTPGTFISNEENNSVSTNNMCIWIESMKDKLNVGIANIEVITGKSIIYEYVIKNTGVPNMYDNIERYISTYSPKEITVITNLSTFDIDSILSFVRNTSITTNIVDLLDKEHINTKRARKCEMQNYQQELFGMHFTILNQDVFFQQYSYCEIAVQSFCYLLQYLSILNPSLIEISSPPVIENLTNHLLLANHSSKQLNIIGDDTHKLSSVLMLTDHTLTAMGKREHKSLLLHPICDPVELEKRYQITQDILDTDGFIEHMRLLLTPLHDLDKITRLIIMAKIPVEGIHKLYNNLINIIDISTYVNEKKVNIHQDPNTILNTSREIIDFISAQIDLENDNVFGNFFKRGIYEDLDTLTEQCMESYDKIQCIKDTLDQLMNLELQSKKVTEYIKLIDTEKGGYTFQITKTRQAPLQRILKSHGDTIDCQYVSTYSGKTKQFKLKSGIIEIQKLNSQLIINSSELLSVCNMNFNTKTKIKEKVNEKFMTFLCELKQYCGKLYEIARFTGYVDVLQNRAYVARQYNYCKPCIVEGDESFVSSTSLRHPLIEHINQNEIYVANDIHVGSSDNHISNDNDISNILLFGTNAVGKTSLIKSLGIAVIMAQSGMYVPSTTFSYVPYRQVFTRILNCDNLFKGLSTFTLEMSEMSNILHYADKNSLVLGDELCSGTEIPSAMSIFLAGLKHLSSINTTFLFATHFHELLNMEEIHEIKNMSFKHMRVRYDESNGSMIYDRKLHEGSGAQIYGLEVCKSLHLPEAFMNEAYKILNKYYPNSIDVLQLDSTQYNAKKLKAQCEICHLNKGDHIHHLLYQKDAIGNFISSSINESVQKNHKANLISICEKCHTDIHRNDLRYVKRQTGNGIKLELCIN